MAVSLAFTSAGTKLYVSAGAPATYDQSGFEAVSWTEVGEITDISEFGRVYSSVTHNPIGDRQTVKRKGSYDDGNITLQLARVPADTGQVILVAAVDSDDSHSFKVVLNDFATTSATTMYFSAQVLSYTTNIGNVNKITTAACAVNIDNSVVEVVAA